MGTLAGCKAGNKSGPEMPPEGQNSPSFETQAPVESNAQQAVGKVTAIDGTKITIENGELKSRTPGNGNGDNGNRKERSGDSDGKRRERPDNDGDNKRERPSDMTRPSGDGNNFPGGFGYSFNATGGNSTFDLSGLTQITIENDDDDTPDTVEEIKTGDVVVIEVDKDGKVTSLTVKSLNGGFGRRGSGGNGQNTSNRNGNGNGSRKERGNKKSRNDNNDNADA